MDFFPLRVKISSILKILNLKNYFCLYLILLKSTFHLSIENIFYKNVIQSLKSFFIPKFDLEDIN